MPNKKRITWEEIHSDTQELAGKIKTTGKTFKGILAITRGGLIPAGIVANELNIKIVETIGLESYQGLEQGNVKILKDANLLPVNYSFNRKPSLKCSFCQEFRL